MTTKRGPIVPFRRPRSRGQAAIEYVLLLAFFIVVIFALMRVSNVLVSGFKSVSKSVARMGP
jgi:uncharacterized protein (UPF0333 family)